MSDARTIFFAGGGTGGHLFPGIAVVEALQTIRPNLRPVFLCTERTIDQVILQPRALEFIPQPIVPPVLTIAGQLAFWPSWRKTKELVNGLLHDRKPVAVIGLGGYAAGAAVKCAAKAKIPTALINPDVVPGKANQYLLRRARIMCCQFEQTRQFVPGSQRHKLRITGCPIRGEFAQLPSRQEAAGRLGLDPLLRTLVVTGASLGAQTINEAVLEVLKTTKPQGWQILHLAGRDHGPKVSAGYQGLGMGARVIGFSVAMADVWAVADLAISRSGASSCAEMTACGVPSILMPYPFHKDQHQKLNARVLAEAGAAVMIDDQRDPRQNAQTLRPVMEGLLFDANKRQTMAARAKAMGKIAAAGSVAQAITELIDTCR